MTGDGDFGGTAPHDIRAEQIVLGAMMLSADARDEIAGILAAGDHYRPAHQVIHNAILRLRDRQEPTDAAAVNVELERGERAGELNAPYLHTLIESVPLAANGVYYARKVVLPYARTRRAQEEPPRAYQMASSPGFDPDEDMDRIRSAVDRATAGQDPAPPSGCPRRSTRSWRRWTAHCRPTRSRRRTRTCGTSSRRCAPAS